VKYAFSGLVLITFAILPEMALSQCLPDPVGTGGIVVCGSDDTNGFDDDANRPDVVVIVNPNVTVSNSEEAMNVKGARAAFENRGIVLSSADRAADIDGVQSTVTNFGEINGDADGLRLGNGAIATNYGTIFSRTRQAIEAQDGSNVTIVNASSGRIRTDQEFGREAIRGGPGLTVINDGRIIAHLDDGVQATSAATIINSGTIRGGSNDAIEIIGGRIENSGRIFSTSSAQGEVDAGIDFDPGAEDGLIINSNLICGEIGIGTDAMNNGVQTIINSGTISGTGGIALSLGNGNDVVVILSGARFGGTIDGGDGTDTLRILDGVSGVFDIEGFENLEIQPNHRFGGRNGNLFVGPVQNSAPLFFQKSCP